MLFSGAANDFFRLRAQCLVKHRAGTAVLANGSFARFLWTPHTTLVLCKLNSR